MLLLLKLKIDPLGNSALQVQIDGEDYSVADIIHEELLGEKHVKFAGVAPPHPLIKTLVIQVHTDGAEPNKSLKEAVRLSQEKVSELLTVAVNTFPDTQRGPRTETSTGTQA